MKKFIFVVVALIVVTTANPVPKSNDPTDIPSNDKLKTEAESCAKSSGDVLASEWEKCAIKCTLVKTGIFDETNGFDVEKVIQLEKRDGRTESAARAIAEKCVVEKEPSETSCGWASRGVECFKAQRPN